MMIPPRRSVTRSHPPRVAIPTPGCGRGRPRSALGVQSAGLEARKRARAIAMRHSPPRLRTFPRKDPSRGPPAASPTRCRRHPVPIPSPERRGASPPRRSPHSREPSGERATRSAICDPLALTSRLPRRFRRGWGAPSPSRPSPGLGSAPGPDVRASESSGRRHARRTRSSTTPAHHPSRKHRVSFAVESTEPKFRPIPPNPRPPGGSAPATEIPRRRGGHPSRPEGGRDSRRRRDATTRPARAR